MLRRRRPPASLPLLSAGRHRRRGSGACVMEYVSVLAGERWTDHPHCVCPTLAALARAVNDTLTDRSRQSLVRWAPDFIGTADAAPEVRLAAGRAVLLTALDRAGDEEERYLVCVGLLSLQRAARERLRAPGDPDIELALLRHPVAARRAHELVERFDVPTSSYLARGLPASVGAAVGIIAKGAGDGADDALLALLGDTVAGYRSGVSGVPSSARR